MNGCQYFDFAWILPNEKVKYEIERYFMATLYWNLDIGN